MANEAQKPAAQSNEQDSVVRLTAADFTIPGLFTEEELRTLTNARREFCVDIENEEGAATVGAHSSHPDAFTRSGIRTIYNLHAAEKRADPVIDELVVEARISQNLALPARPTSFLQFIGLRNWEPAEKQETHYELTVSRRYRDADFNTRTLDTISLIAVRDPADPESFIVESATNYIENRGATAAWFPAKILPMPLQQGTEQLRGNMKAASARFETLKATTGVTREDIVLTSKIPLPPG